MALSMVEVAGLAYDAGLRNPARIAQAVAIATAETGRDPGRVGDTGRSGEKTSDGRHWGPSVGLWQIRSIQEEKGKGTTRDQDALKDPARNAKSMAEISSAGSDFGPWSVTHATQDPAGYLRYQAALPLAGPAAAQALAGKGAGQIAEEAQDTASGVLDPVLQLASTVSEVAQTPIRLANWLTESGSWVRIGLFVGGGLLLILGLVKTAEGPMQAKAAQAAKLILPTGKAGKILGKVAK